MPKLNILAHTSFIGETGFANHARSFFTSLNKYHNVKVRNFTIGNSWDNYSKNEHDKEFYITDEHKTMLIEQTLLDNDKSRSDYPLYNYTDKFKADIHIILSEVNHHYFYDSYDGYKIAYTVWESTKYPDNFFNKLLEYDELWVPTEWQRNCSIDQGYPPEKVKVVNEAVDIEIFKPEKKRKSDKFKFLLFGRWDYRKSTTEIIKEFSKTFSENENVELICSIENAFPNDGIKSTKDRLEYYDICHTNNIKIIDFVQRDEYVDYLKQGDVFVSCARSEGWNLPLIEAMACGTPSIYSNWGGQLEFATGKGIPIKIKGLLPANIDQSGVDFPGEYCEPDYDDLSYQMRKIYDEYDNNKIKALLDSDEIRKNFNWDAVAKRAADILEFSFENKFNDFTYITAGNIGYMSLIEKLVQSLMEFSKRKIIVYGIDCEVPFDYPNVIKKTITTPKISEHDNWYWKQWACIESLNLGFDNYVWLDGDVVVNHNVDSIKKYFKDIENYPISDIHVQEEFFGWYDNGNKSQSFNEQVANEWGVQKQQPYMHVCMYVFNSKCQWWFEEIISHYVKVMETNPDDYKRLYLWNDEGIDNVMRWKYNFKKHLPQSNFDTSSYDGDDGMTNETQHHFLKFWNEEGPQNFNRIFGYQAIPKDKNQILYFHGNKNAQMSDFMMDFIKMKRDASFYKSEQFYTSLNTNVYKLENLGDIKNVEGWTIHIANKYGWPRAIYHEIFNLCEYYKSGSEMKINEGDTVVDLGANIGIFNRWAFHQGASKVISFEPDKRYFKLLSLNADPRSILFNAAISNEMGELNLYESSHLGGSNVFGSDGKEEYSIKTYTLNYLFECGLIDYIDFLKVDIEGSEHLAFSGISDENLQKVKTIAMEYHHGHFDFDDELRANFIKKMNGLGFNSYLMFMDNNNGLQMIYFWK